MISPFKFRPSDNSLRGYHTLRKLQTSFSSNAFSNPSTTLDAEDRSDLIGQFIYPAYIFDSDLKNEYSGLHVYRLSSNSSRNIFCDPISEFTSEPSGSLDFVQKCLFYSYYYPKYCGFIINEISWCPRYIDEMRSLVLLLCSVQSDLSSGIPVEIDQVIDRIYNTTAGVFDGEKIRLYAFSHLFNMYLNRDGDLEILKKLFVSPHNLPKKLFVYYKRELSLRIALSGPEDSSEPVILQDADIFNKDLLLNQEKTKNVLKKVQDYSDDLNICRMLAKGNHDDAYAALLKYSSTFSDKNPTYTLLRKVLEIDWDEERSKKIFKTLNKHRLLNIKLFEIFFSRDLSKFDNETLESFLLSYISKGYVFTAPIIQGILKNMKKLPENLIIDWKPIFYEDRTLLHQLILSYPASIEEDKFKSVVVPLLETCKKLDICYYSQFLLPSLKYYYNSEEFSLKFIIDLIDFDKKDLDLKKLGAIEEVLSPPIYVSEPSDYDFKVHEKVKSDFPSKKFNLLRCYELAPYFESALRVRDYDFLLTLSRKAFNINFKVPLVYLRGAFIIEAESSYNYDTCRALETLFEDNVGWNWLQMTPVEAFLVLQYLYYMRNFIAYCYRRLRGFPLKIGKIVVTIRDFDLISQEPNFLTSGFVSDNLITSFSEIRAMYLLLSTITGPFMGDDIYIQILRQFKFSSFPRYSNWLMQFFATSACFDKGTRYRYEYLEKIFFDMSDPRIAHIYFTYAMDFLREKPALLKKLVVKFKYLPESVISDEIKRINVRSSLPGRLCISVKDSPINLRHKIIASVIYKEYQLTYELMKILIPKIKTNGYEPLKLSSVRDFFSYADPDLTYDIINLLIDNGHFYYKPLAKLLNRADRDLERVQSVIERFKANKYIPGRNSIVNMVYLGVVGAWDIIHEWQSFLQIDDIIQSIIFRSAPNYYGRITRRTYYLNSYNTYKEKYQSYVMNGGNEKMDINFFRNLHKVEENEVLRNGSLDQFIFHVLLCSFESRDLELTQLVYNVASRSNLSVSLFITECIRVLGNPDLTNSLFNFVTEFLDNHFSKERSCVSQVIRIYYCLMMANLYPEYSRTTFRRVCYHTCNYDWGIYFHFLVETILEKDQKVFENDILEMSETIKRLTKSSDSFEFYSHFMSCFLGKIFLGKYPEYVKKYFLPLINREVSPEWYHQLKNELSVILDVDSDKEEYERKFHEENAIDELPLDQKIYDNWQEISISKLLFNSGDSMTAYHEFKKFLELGNSPKFATLNRFICFDWDEEIFMDLFKSLDNVNLLTIPVFEVIFSKNISKFGPDNLSFIASTYLQKDYVWTKKIVFGFIQNKIEVADKSVDWYKLIIDEPSIIHKIIISFQRSPRRLLDLLDKSKKIHYPYYLQILLPSLEDYYPPRSPQSDLIKGLIERERILSREDFHLEQLYRVDEILIYPNIMERYPLKRDRRFLENYNEKKRLFRKEVFQKEKVFVLLDYLNRALVMNDYPFFEEVALEMMTMGIRIPLMYLQMLLKYLREEESLTNLSFSFVKKLFELNLPSDWNKCTPIEAFLRLQFIFYSSFISKEYAKELFLGIPLEYSDCLGKLIHGSDLVGFLFSKADFNKGLKFLENRIMYVLAYMKIFGNKSHHNVFADLISLSENLKLNYVTQWKAFFVFHVLKFMEYRPCRDSILNSPALDLANKEIAEHHHEICSYFSVFYTKEEKRRFINQTINRFSLIVSRADLKSHFQMKRAINGSSFFLDDLFPQNIIRIITLLLRSKTPEDAINFLKSAINQIKRFREFSFPDVFSAIILSSNTSGEQISELMDLADIYDLLSPKIFRAFFSVSHKLRSAERVSYMINLFESCDYVWDTDSVKALLSSGNPYMYLKFNDQFAFSHDVSSIVLDETIYFRDFPGFYSSYNPKKDQGYDMDELAVTLRSLDFKSSKEIISNALMEFYSKSFPLKDKMLYDQWIAKLIVSYLDDHEYDIVESLMGIKLNLMTSMMLSFNFLHRIIDNSLSVKAFRIIEKYMLSRYFNVKSILPAEVSIFYLYLLLSARIYPKYTSKLLDSYRLAPHDEFPECALLSYIIRKISMGNSIHRSVFNEILIKMCNHIKLLRDRMQVVNFCINQLYNAFIHINTELVDIYLRNNLDIRHGLDTHMIIDLEVICNYLKIQTESEDRVGILDMLHKTKKIEVALMEIHHNLLSKMPSFSGLKNLSHIDQNNDSIEKETELFNKNNSIEKDDSIHTKNFSIEIENLVDTKDHSIGEAEPIEKKDDPIDGDLKYVYEDGDEKVPIDDIDQYIKDILEPSSDNDLINDEFNEEKNNPYSYDQIDLDESIRMLNDNYLPNELIKNSESNEVKFDGTQLSKFLYHLKYLSDEEILESIKQMVSKKSFSFSLNTFKFLIRPLKSAEYKMGLLNYLDENNLLSRRVFEIFFEDFDKKSESMEFIMKLVKIYNQKGYVWTMQIVKVILDNNLPLPNPELIDWDKLYHERPSIFAEAIRNYSKIGFDSENDSLVMSVIDGYNDNFNSIDALKIILSKSGNTCNFYKLQVLLPILKSYYSEGSPERLIVDMELSEYESSYRGLDLSLVSSYEDLFIFPCFDINYKDYNPNILTFSLSQKNVFINESYEFYDVLTFFEKSLATVSLGQLRQVLECLNAIHRKVPLFYLQKSLKLISNPEFVTLNLLVCVEEIFNHSMLDWDLCSPEYSFVKLQHILFISKLYPTYGLQLFQKIPRDYPHLKFVENQAILLLIQVFTSRSANERFETIKKIKDHLDKIDFKSSKSFSNESKVYESYWKAFINLHILEEVNHMETAKVEQLFDLESLDLSIAPINEAYENIIKYFINHKSDVTKLEKISLFNSKLELSSIIDLLNSLFIESRKNNSCEELEEDFNSFLQILSSLDISITNIPLRSLVSLVNNTCIPEKNIDDLISTITSLGIKSPSLLRAYFSRISKRKHSNDRSVALNLLMKTYSESGYLWYEEFATYSTDIQHKPNQKLEKYLMN